MPIGQKQKNRTPLATKAIPSPGFNGLNTELVAGGGFVDDTWASVLQNTVWDDLGRAALRKGWSNVTTTPITGEGEVTRIHEYVNASEITTLIAITTSFTIHESTNNGATWTNISGDFTSDSLATTAVRFVNFNGDVYATAPGFKVYRYTGTGSFTEIADSSASRGIIMAAYGRLWVPEDATDSILYSGLLVGTDWTSTASGSIDAENVWTDGQDTIQALFAFGSSFLVFGKEHILVYTDGAGSVLGIDPTSMYVVDTIEGTGCSHQDSIINIGEGDLWFMSDVGVQSLARVLSDKVNPLNTLSKNVDSLVAQLQGLHTGSDSSVQAVYSPENNIVIYNFPESATQLVFDTRFQLQDSTYRATTWNIAANAVTRRRNGNVNFGLAGGEIALYSTYLDDDAAIVIKYATPWADFGPEVHSQLKILKHFKLVVFGRGTLSGTARWGKDYRPLEYSQTFTNAYVTSGAEWGDGEWGSGNFATGVRMRNEHIPAIGQGQVIKFYVEIQSDVADTIAIQEIGMYAKLGRRV